MAQVEIPAATTYAITVQDANSRVWQNTTYDSGPAGIATNTHSYTELCSGLNHLVNGKWVESSEQIDILPNGTAVATNGQHQAYFPGDIYQGQIELVTPDGLQLYSRPMGLSYFDGTNSVLIAELTNSVGVVVGNNQVVYPNAFTDFRADLRYTYTKAGFEQDIILRQQPPTPESLGINPDTARLQILTEFFSPPQPTIESAALPTQAGLSLTDESLGFGAMQMVPGRAFLLGANATDAGALVDKQWLLLNGRQFLVEEVPVDAILEGLAALPLTAMNSSPSKYSHTASKHLKLPPQRVAQNTSKSVMLAKSDSPTKGFVLDYQTLNSTITNFTFQGDTTYYNSNGAVNLYGTTTVEGGAVIKFARGSSGLSCEGPIVCKTSAYRPAVLTAVDDNSVGENITGSNTVPSGVYSSTYLVNYGSAVDLEYLRVCYATTGIELYSGSGNILRHCQFFGNGGDLYLLQNTSADNCLFQNSKAFSFGGSSAAVVSMVNCTAHNISELNGGVVLSVTNSLLIGVTNLGASFTSVNNYTNISDAGIFQIAGAGNNYLAANSPYRNAGKTNIDQTLLASLKQKTTYPPILYSNVTVSINTTLSPQAQRDTDTPDLGYHYDPIDYLVDQFVMTNAALTLTSGVAIANYNDTGIWLQDGSSITSIGSPLYPNWLVRYSSAGTIQLSADFP